MRLLITKDASTIVPVQVADVEEAKRVQERGFHVHVVIGESKIPLDDYVARMDKPEPVDEPADDVPAQPGVLARIANFLTGS